ncbi:MAG: DUF1016 family protein [Spirochaetaceae bacterium]|nr:DUF1016 family protein [Spirochaetaceae bacterium]MBQ7366455.1 DUF1016 family protein [Spirochaetaceae bacterium]
MKNGDLITYTKTDDIFTDAKLIVTIARKRAYKAADTSLIMQNWLLGKRLAEEVLEGEDRAKYGAGVIKNLSKQLTQEFGKGFTPNNLYYCKQFYEIFPEIFHTVCGKSMIERLSWSHFRVLLQVSDSVARNWYMNECANESWAVKTLQRNVSTQYYYRLLASDNKSIVKNEMQEKTATFQNDTLEFIKNPMIAEFLGLTPNSDFSETELESAIITNLQKFLMELGKGYAFVARQQHIHTEKKDYYIDLVFYNYILKCFVLIDLKIGTVTHQDVGQMDMYVRMYDELKKSSDDNPTIGIILCSDTDEDIARFSMLKGNEQLFTTKYKTYLPSEEELCAEIKKQKELFYLQHSSLNESEEM